MYHATLVPAAAGLLLLLLAAPALANRNPCHRNKNAQGAGVTCERVVIPPNLCSSCRLKADAFGAFGNFKNCRAIYDPTEATCASQLRYYASQNRQCDPVRSEQIKDLSNPANVEGLDYFLYTVCEQCCDCIVRGSKEEEWFSRKRSGENLSAVRGNCPAHGFYDICKIWPKVKYVSRPKGRLDVTRPRPFVDDQATDVCDDLRKWRNNPANKDWLLKDTSVITDNVKRFFERFFDVVQCQRKDIWVPCIKLETAQGRL